MRLLGIIFLLCLPTVIFGQTDTVFWFAAPDVQSRHDDRPIELKLISTGKPATVVISIPANNSFTPITRIVPVGGVINLDLTNFINDIENSIANDVNKKGLLIKSSSPIQAYYEVQAKGRNTDIFALKGQNGLDTLFFIAGNNLIPNWNIQVGTVYYNGLLIVATKDSTKVHITPFVDVHTYKAGQRYTITLNKGEVFYLRSKGSEKTHKLAGSKIQSNHAIAITYFDDSVFPSLTFPGVGTCADLCGDQLVGYSMLGNKYLAVKGPYLNSPLNDIVFITGTENGTQLRINKQLMTNLNAGEVYSYVFKNTDETVLIETSKKVAVAQISGFGCELGLGVLPALECTGGQRVAFTRSDANTSTAFMVTLLVPTGFEKDFKVNGNIISPAQRNQFDTVKGTNGKWKFANIDLSSTVGANSQVNISNDSIVFHCGMINGGSVGSGCRFGYFSDFARTKPKISIPDIAMACAGQPLNIQFNIVAGSNTEWYTPDGKLLKGPKLYLKKLQLKDSGFYIGNVEDVGCGNKVRDTIYLQIDSVYSTWLGNFKMCEGDSFKGIARSHSLTPILVDIWKYPVNKTFFGDTFSWKPPAPNKYLITYEAVATSGCKFKLLDTLVVNGKPNSKIQMIGKCAGEVFQFKNQNQWGLYSNSGNLNWKINKAPFTSVDSTVYLNGIKAHDTLIATLVIVNEKGCRDSSNIGIKAKPTPLVELVSDTICVNQDYLPKYRLDSVGLNAFNYQWKIDQTIASNSSQPTFNALLAGNRKVVFQVASLEGCIGSDTAFIEVVKLPVINFQNTLPLCQGNAITFWDAASSNSGLDKTVWREWNIENNSYRDSAIQYIFKTYGDKRIQLTLRNAAGCIDSLFKNTAIISKPIASLQLQPSCVDAVSSGDASVLWGNGNYKSFLWSVDGINYNQQSFKHTFIQPGIKKVELTVENIEGCRDTVEGSLEIYAKPKAAFNFSPNPTKPFVPVVFTNLSTEGTQWIWKPNQFEEFTQRDFEYIFKKGGFYKVQLIVSNDSGCRDTAEESIQVNQDIAIYVPNAFTPNKDTKNEGFRAYELEGQTTQFNMKIYNRWGEKLWETQNSEESWDGTYGGKPCQQEMYIYYIYFRDLTGRFYKKEGTFLLFR